MSHTGHYRGFPIRSLKETKNIHQWCIASHECNNFDIPWVTWFTHTHTPKWACAQGTYNKFNVLTLDLCLALRRNGNTADIHLDKHGSTLSTQHEPKDNGNNTCKVKPRFTVPWDEHVVITEFALSLGKERPYIFSEFNPLNTDTF